MTDIKLTWNNRTTNAVSQKIYRSLEEFDSSNLPTVHAEVAFWIKEYLDEDVTEDAYWYMLSTVTEDDELFSDCVRIEKGGAGECDPHWDNVVALLHFDGNMSDETGRIWDQLGVTIIGGAGRFGGCITFSGSPYERVTSTHQAFGTDDWTVEMWVKFNLTSGQQNFFENLNSSGINPAGRFTIYQYFGSLRVFINSQDRIITPVPSTNTWHHLSVSCESGLVRLFVNGSIKGSWNSGGLNFDQTLTIFGAGFGTSSLFGSLDELRITKGVARYTENFIPPTKPFPNC